MLVGKRPLGRSRHRYMNSIANDFVEIKWFGVNWIGLPHDKGKWRALVNSVMNLLVS
jgi:hypothetical protein